MPRFCVRHNTIPAPSHDGTPLRCEPYYKPTTALRFAASLTTNRRRHSASLRALLQTDDGTPLCCVPYYEPAFFITITSQGDQVMKWGDQVFD